MIATGAGWQHITLIFPPPRTSKLSVRGLDPQPQYLKTVSGWTGTPSSTSKKYMGGPDHTPSASKLSLGSLSDRHRGTFLTYLWGIQSSPTGISLIDILGVDSLTQRGDS